MKRLIKTSNIDDVKLLLDRIDSASDNLKDSYYVLFDNLNALYNTYPNLYKQIEMVVKLPNNNDAKDIVNMNEDLKRILDNLKNEDYLNSYIK